MATVREFLKGTMRLMEAIATGETPSNDELVDGMSALNRMLSSWSIEKLVVYGRVREEFSLVAGTQSYTIGSGGTFSTTKPIEIEEAKLEDQSVTPTVETPVEIINMQQWAAIKIKDQSADIPYKMYREVGASTDTLYFWPKPSATNKIVLYSFKAFTSFSSLDTSVTYPPGYEEAMMFNLAVRWGLEFGKSFGPETEVGRQAKEYKANIERLNSVPVLLGIDPALLPRKPYDIYTGE